MTLSAQVRRLRSVVCAAAALPLKEDFEEAGPVYGALCGLATSAETAPIVANLMPQLVQVRLPYPHHLAEEALLIAALLYVVGQTGTNMQHWML